MTTLQITQLHKKFPIGKREEIKVLKGVDLEMEEGDFHALMGASGSGKSTLLNIVGALIPPTSGSIIVNGKEISAMDDRELTLIRRSEIGWIFQDFNLIDGLSALENVLLPLNLSGHNDSEAEENALDKLQRVGLVDRKDHMPDHLSGGQQQRVAIARALVNNPSIILADEPTGNLDSDTGKEVIEIFKKLATEGKIILMVTHDVQLAHASQKVFILQNGIIHEEVGQEVI